MFARIYRPARTAMQSGQAGSREWVLEFEPELPHEVEPLMGYTTQRDMRQQVRLRFATRDEAVAYAEREGIPYRVFEAHEPERKRIAYADNFGYKRVGQWTH
jgi:hypothetical protein